MKASKILAKAKSSPQNIRFGDMQKLVEALGFRLDRIKGSHHIYVHPDIPDQINLQDDDGKAKAYQVRQVLKIVRQHNLKPGDDS